MTPGKSFWDHHEKNRDQVSEVRSSRGENQMRRKVNNVKEAMKREKTGHRQGLQKGQR